MNNANAISILVADDDPDDRLLLEDAFRDNSIENDIHFVEDGEELVAFLRREGRFEDQRGHPYPGLILLDLNMPKMDGREALRQIKDDEQLRCIPVVVLSTSSAEEDIERTYFSGVNSFITKPVTYDDLLDIVRTLKTYWIDMVRLPPPCQTN